MQYSSIRFPFLLHFFLSDLKKNSLFSNFHKWVFSQYSKHHHHMRSIIYSTKLLRLVNLPLYHFSIFFSPFFTAFSLPFLFRHFLFLNSITSLHKTKRICFSVCQSIVIFLSSTDIQRRFENKMAELKSVIRVQF